MKSLTMNCCLSDALKTLSTTQVPSRAPTNIVLLCYQITMALSCHPPTEFNISFAFNIIFQSHFMLSKARIREPFADMGFVEELLFIKQWRHDLIVVHHHWLAPVPVQAMPSCDVCGFLI